MASVIICVLLLFLPMTIGGVLVLIRDHETRGKYHLLNKILLGWGGLLGGLIGLAWTMHRLTGFN